MGCVDLMLKVYLTKMYSRVYNIPVMGVIASGENSAHELFVIGYFADTDMYQTLNPATGTFQAFNKNDFYGNTLYKVNSFK